MIKLNAMKNIQIWFLMLLLAFISCKKEKENGPAAQAINSEIALGMTGRFIIDMEIDKNSQFYFVTTKGFSVPEPGTPDPTRFYFLRKMSESGQFEILDSNFVHVNKITFDKNNNLWGINLHGLFLRKNNTCDTIIKLDFDNGEGIFQCIAVDEDNNVWAGSSEGLYKIDELQNITKYTIENSILTSNYIEDIHVDENNNIWFSLFGTNDLVEIKGNSWMIYSSPGLVSQTIWSIEADKNANLWIGKGWSDQSETLVRFNGAIWETVNPKNETDKMVLGTARHLISDRNRLYVVVESNSDHSNQLLTFDGVNWNKIQGLPEPTMNLVGLKIDYQRHYLWIVTLNSGIYKLKI